MSYWSYSQPVAVVPARRQSLLSRVLHRRPRVHAASVAAVDHGYWGYSPNWDWGYGVNSYSSLGYNGGYWGFEPGWGWW